jgi:hypothetical protein
MQKLQIVVCRTNGWKSKNQIGRARNIHRKQFLISIRAANIIEYTRILKHTKHYGNIEDMYKRTDNELRGSSLYIDISTTWVIDPKATHVKLEPTVHTGRRNRSLQFR